MLRLKELRQFKGYTQKKLSILASVSQGKICEYESGKTIPRTDTAIKLADALDCSLDELMGQEPKAKVS